MKRRNISRVRQTAPAKVQGQQKFQVLLIALICVAAVAAGFFSAARQHFATMDFGLKNSQLRRQVENLEAERRRLILAKETSLSPASIKQTASKLGFREQVTAPPSSADVRVESSAARTAPAAEFTSFKPQATVSSAATVSKKVEKSLLKPIVQQTTVKTTSPDQRPRIAKSETVASISAKPLAKLR